MKFSKGIRRVSLLLIFSLLLSSGVMAAENENHATTAMTAEQRSRLEDVLQNQMVEMTSGDKTRSTQEGEISAIKEITNFTGDKYTVAEIDPIGYMIFHNDSGTFSEYSPTAPSPYKDYQDTTNLFYCGPMEYYALVGDNYIHTITGAITKRSHENLTAAETVSEKVSEHYLETPDINVLNYIETGNGDITKTASTRAIETYIPGQAQINNLNSKSEMSFCSPSGTNGICGYIAAAITLSWYDTYKNGAIINDDTYFVKARGYNVFNGSPTDYAHSGNGYKRTFSYNLWHYCSKNPDDNGSTIGGDIRDTINTYLHSNRGINSLSASSSWFFTTDTIVNNVVKEGKPTILFGSLAKEGENWQNHAVTVYGQKDGNRLIAHMGWEGYDNVYIEGIWGDMVEIS